MSEGANVDQTAAYTPQLSSVQLVVPPSVPSAVPQAFISAPAGSSFPVVSPGLSSLSYLPSGISPAPPIMPASAAAACYMYALTGQPPPPSYPRPPPPPPPRYPPPPFKPPPPISPSPYQLKPPPPASSPPQPPPSAPPTASESESSVILQQSDADMIEELIKQKKAALSAASNSPTVSSSLSLSSSSSDSVAIASSSIDTSERTSDLLSPVACTADKVVVSGSDAYSNEDEANQSRSLVFNEECHENLKQRTTADNSNVVIDCCSTDTDAVEAENSSSLPEKPATAEPAISSVPKDSVDENSALTDSELSTCSVTDALDPAGTDEITKTIITDNTQSDHLITSTSPLVKDDLDRIAISNTGAAKSKGKKRAAGKLKGAKNAGENDCTNSSKKKKALEEDLSAKDDESKQRMQEFLSAVRGMEESGLCNDRGIGAGMVK